MSHSGTYRGVSLMQPRLGVSAKLTQLQTFDSLQPVQVPSLQFGQ